MGRMTNITVSIREMVSVESVRNKSLTSDIHNALLATLRKAKQLFSLTSTIFPSIQNQALVLCALLSAIDFPQVYVNLEMLVLFQPKKELVKIHIKRTAQLIKCHSRCQNKLLIFEAYRCKVSIPCGMPTV